jgi:hypothetical protein
MDKTIVTTTDGAWKETMQFDEFDAAYKYFIELTEKRTANELDICSIDAENAFIYGETRWMNGMVAIRINRIR